MVRLSYAASLAAAIFGLQISTTAAKTVAGAYLIEFEDGTVCFPATILPR